MPLVELVTVGVGHVPASSRLVGTAIGAEMRLKSHETSESDGRLGLRLLMTSERFGVQATMTMTSTPGIAALRATVTLTNTGSSDIILRSVTSFVTGLGGSVEEEVAGDWSLVSGTSDWLGEGRWRHQSLADLLPRLEERLTGHNPRSSHQQASHGTWSTGRALPFAAVESVGAHHSWMWQVEHNGPWRWDVGQDTAGPWFAAGGPTDADAGWTKRLEIGEEFTTVPVSVAVGTDLESSVAAMTQHRRDLRRPHRDNTEMTVVFNDYMNTLNGDPTTDKLLPLIDAAAAVGAEVFCIDAGWYDETGDWWDSVGEWTPSLTRFPGGLGEVVEHIRARGMTPGLWLEPEVVGTASPVAERLPDEAFFTVGGQRIVEHDRFHLDLRHEAAVGHLNGVVDRLVADYGVGFFKFDYNIDPGTGPTRDADSPGDGLLEHNRAHLAWIDSVLDRHPELVIENCSSGAMRMDPALMQRLAMQSTSDQQDFTRYPPIAASAPMAILPEQAASWAYPQPGMSQESIAFCLVTGLLGRFYLSGFLNRMAEEELALVRESVAVAKVLRAELPTTRPTWPSGLPSWSDPWVSMGLEGPRGLLLSVWRRGGPDEFVLTLPRFAGREIEVTTVFPRHLPSWDVAWSPRDATLTLRGTPEEISARTFRVESPAAGRDTADTPDHPEPGAAHKGA
jgi:alpha-galactosidase